MIHEKIEEVNKIQLNLWVVLVFFILNALMNVAFAETSEYGQYEDLGIKMYSDTDFDSNVFSQLADYPYKYVVWTYTSSTGGSSFKGMFKNYIACDEPMVVKKYDYHVSLQPVEGANCSIYYGYTGAIRNFNGSIENPVNFNYGKIPFYGTNGYTYGFYTELDNIKMTDGGYFFQVPQFLPAQMVETMTLDLTSHQYLMISLVASMILLALLGRFLHL